MKNAVPDIKQAYPDYLAAAASKRLLVEPGKKVFIRKQLESLGLTPATIFPEIDRVADFIKGIYANSGHSESSAPVSKRWSE